MENIKNKEKFTKDLLISHLMEKTQLSKKICETFYLAYPEVILEALMNKHDVKFGNFGTFKFKRCAARVCRSISNQQTIHVPAKGSSSFSLSKNSKEKLAPVI